MVEDGGAGLADAIQYHNRQDAANGGYYPGMGNFPVPPSVPSVPPVYNHAQKRHTNTPPSSSTTPRAQLGSRKRKDAESEGDEKKPKKTRQTQSCDACRARKVKCDRPPPGSTPEGVPTKDYCTHCHSLGMKCTFEYKPKKRGPPNMYLKRMQALGQASVDAAASVSPVDRLEYESARQGPGPGTLAQQNALHRSALSTQGISVEPHHRGRDTVDDWGPALAKSLAAHQHKDHHRPQQQQQQPVEAPPGTNAFSLPHTASFSQTRRASSGRRESHNGSPATSYAGAAGGNPLDAVLPRSLLYHLIDLYFDYVYCLVPCLHKPSFMRDLHNRREEQPGQEEFVALIFAVIEVTLVQMPRAFIQLPKRDIKALFTRAHLTVQEFVHKDLTQLNIDRVVLLYLHGIATHTLSLPLACDAVWGQNYFLSLRLRLHEESSYQNLNPIERELRKRMFWLQYGGDKTISAIDGSSVIWHESDTADVTLPSPLDDEFVTEDGYLEQPEGHTPVLAGFYYISKLFRLLGQILDKRKDDRIKPPSGLLLQMRINEVEQIFNQVMTLMDGCPDALKLEMSGTPGAKMNDIDQRWDAYISADIRQLLLDPSLATRSVADTFLVQQANIYVTQQMVRFIAIQYREELGALQDKELVNQTGIDEIEPPGAPTNTNRRLSQIRLGRTGFTEEEKDQVASDLLLILSKIRLEVIAVNSFALVAKVRFVASTLLDALQSPPALPVHTTTPEMIRANERTARAQGYLWDFLRILSDIEALYMMDDEED
ncbi:hypothetical protein Q8F55_006915 [Vanrija albida]|uniref:Zn(2)-C6 fungal-type domain-containing protein n=1 Tax=Vanrija albida TaxID=181172 RepID=A0ABR3PZ92_9TREE